MIKKRNYLHTMASRKLKYIAALCITFICINSASAQADVNAGEELFKANCTSCHAIDKKVIGPKLEGVTKKYTEEWLIKWIKNNEALRKSGDAQANAIYNEYNGAAMNLFANFSDDDVKNILAYIVAYVPPAPKEVAGGQPEQGFYSSYNFYLLFVLAIILAIVFAILLRIFAELKKLNKQKEAELAGITFEEATQNWWNRNKHKFIIVNPTISVLAYGTGFLALVFMPWFFWFGVNKVGVQQGYQPTQPINYSHALHAGELEIDCKYCHSTVEISKSASIPSLNTCMNCHKGVQLTDKYNGEISPEIKKIYAALDYDPTRDPGKEYGPNRKAIKWVRIHNLPDHAYFNHSQHVKVAGLQCQECHGPIQDMEVVEQYSSLQMGWCIDCHRTKGIDVENNNYYEKLHASVKSKMHGADSANVHNEYFKDGKLVITPSMNGGIECAKCHY